MLDKSVRPPNDVKSLTGDSALRDAIESGNIPTVQHLLRHSPRSAIDDLEEDETALHIAVKNGPEDVVEEILVFQACFDFQKLGQGPSAPLRRRSSEQSNMPEFKASLIRRRNGVGRTALHLAVLDNHEAF